MRTRTRSIARRTAQVPAGPYTVKTTFCTGVIQTGTVNRSSLTQVSAGRDERITDHLGRGTSHAVTHRVFDYDYNDSLGSVAYGSSSGGMNVKSYSVPFAWYDGDIQAVRASLAWDVNNGVALPPGWSMTTSVDETAVVNQLFSRARQLKADVLLNLVEANQVWPAINSLARSLPLMAAHWWELRKVIRTASAAFLAWKFGVSPILSDIMSVQRHLPKMQSDIKRHTDGDVQRFSAVLQPVLYHADGAYASGSLNGYPSYEFTRQGRMISSPTVRYVLAVQPKAKYMTSFFSKADYAMSRFATSPASLAWELVPFSFVVDWFVDLRGALNRLDALLGSSPYIVKSLTRSFSYTVAADHHITTWSPCGGGLLQTFRAGSAEYKHYERSVVPNGQLVTWNPRFGKNQAAISAALITQALLKIPGAMRF